MVHGGQLYSPSPGRKGDSSLSGQKGSDTSGIKNCFEGSS